MEFITLAEARHRRYISPEMLTTAYHALLSGRTPEEQLACFSLRITEEMSLVYETKPSEESTKTKLFALTDCDYVKAVVMEDSILIGVLVNDDRFVPPGFPVLLHGCEVFEPGYVYTAATHAQLLFLPDAQT